MIRSLVITLNSQPLTDETGKDAAGHTSTLQRNQSQDRLEAFFAEGSIMWIDVISPEDEEIHWLEDLLREDRRPTLLVYPGYLFLSLFQPLSQGNAILGKEIHCIVGKHFYVTVRQTDASALQESYNRVVQNPASWDRGVAYFLYLTAQHTIDAYYPLLDRIGNQLHELEEQFLSDSDDKQAQESVYRIKNHLIRLRQMIAPQREVLSNLMGEQLVSSNRDVRDLFRHLYERLLGIYDVIDSQRDLSGNVLEIISNHHARKIGEAVNRLTVISMVFLPFALFVGMFDAGFFNVSEAVNLPVDGLGITIVIILMIIASIVIMGRVFQQRGWI
jgi:magnesium transporter